LTKLVRRTRMVPRTSLQLRRLKQMVITRRRKSQMNLLRAHLQRKMKLKRYQLRKIARATLLMTHLLLKMSQQTRHLPMKKPTKPPLRLQKNLRPRKRNPNRQNLLRTTQVMTKPKPRWKQKSMQPKQSLLPSMEHRTRPRTLLQLMLQTNREMQRLLATTPFHPQKEMMKLRE
jgi:hypothetical protein